MKVLVVGSDKIFSIENFYVKYLKGLSVDIEVFTAQSIFYDYYYGGSIFTKVLYKLGLSSIYSKINVQFRDAVSQFKPDIVWVFKGMEISPESIRWAKKQGVLLVNYNPDNPFVFSGKGSGNANVTESIKLYDFHFTYDLGIQKKIEQSCNIPAVYLPFGFDLSNAMYDQCTGQQEVNRVCFLGNPDKQRASFIQTLVDNGVEMDVYGNGWEKFINHKNIQCFPAVYGLDFWMTLRRYRVQLNLMRIHNENSHNMRSFEVPAVGGIGLYPKTAEHSLFFEENSEVFLYTDVKDCIRKITAILSMDDDSINIIRTNARERLLSSHYSYRDRAKQVHSEFVHQLKAT